MTKTADKPLTADDFKVPKNIPELIGLAFAKFGPGAVFLVMLVWVYADKQASERRYAEQSEATVTAILKIANAVDKATDQVDQMRESVRRIENTAAQK